MAAQTQNVIISQSAVYPPVYKVPEFSFLAKPAQRKRLASVAPFPAPLCSPPPVPTNRPRSHSYSKIINWVTNVQPGTPSPWTPLCRSSIASSCSRRPSISRRKSTTQPTGSFLLITTPTSPQSFTQIDLTTLGYTSVFVHLPKTPTAPSADLRRLAPAGAFVGKALIRKLPVPPAPQTESKRPRNMKRFRSLTLLRPKGPRAKDQDEIPAPVSAQSSKLTFSSKAGKHHLGTPANTAATIAKRKRAKYANVQPPPTLASELAMMQFADGGSMEKNIKRVMDAQAKAAAGSSGVRAVADVYRDEKGGVWWDEDEEMEYAHLLGGAVDRRKAEREAGEMDWEDFAHRSSGTGGKENVGPSSPKDGSRRPSFTSSIDSDLDQTYLLPLPELANEAYPTFTSGPLDDRVLSSSRHGGAGMSVLSLPARPRRKAMHLNKPGFLVDVEAFGLASPGSASTEHEFSTGGRPKPRGNARRRPPPLRLANSSHSRANVRAATGGLSPRKPTTSPALDTVTTGRREFMENSFAPKVSSTSSGRTTQMHGHLAAGSERSVTSSRKRSTSTLTLRNLFTRRND